MEKSDFGSKDWKYEQFLSFEEKLDVKEKVEAKLLEVARYVQFQDYFFKFSPKRIFALFPNYA